MTVDSEPDKRNYPRLLFSYLVIGVIFVFDYFYSMIAPGFTSFESRMTKSQESISLCKKLIWGGILNSCILLYASHIFVALRLQGDRSYPKNGPAFDESLLFVLWVPGGLMEDGFSIL